MIITRDKNKLKSETKNKILVLGLILIMLVGVGLFSPMAKVDASPANPTEDCAYLSGQGNSNIATNAPCVDRRVGGTGVTQETAVIQPAAPEPSTGTPFEQELNACSLFYPSTWGMCIAKIFYYTYFQLPAMVLWVAAQFFNATINLGIDSALTISSGFIPAAWAVVRDLSNIFFILILLYVGIQTILGLGHETKKIIVRVIIMALLINFSLFFTKVIIDSSNILALVFYNKLEIKEDRPNDLSRPEDEKDIAGQMWKTFDATRLVGPEVIEVLKTQTISVEGKIIPTDEKVMPFSFAMGMIVIAGSIMLWASYAFFIAGIMFIGRLIELWLLIIFAPFAFMSWTLPKFAGIEYLGWDNWFKRLISTSFMAPIFMFFIYLILLLLPHIGMFNTGNEEKTMLSIILGILIPSIVIMALLLKAVHFAKKGGGQFGELALSGLKLATGLAVGLASGGTALAGRAAVGAVAKSVVNDTARGKALQLGGNLKSNFKSGWSYVNPAAYARGAGILGKAGTAGVAELIHKTPSWKKDSTGNTMKLGKVLQEEHEGYEHATHATHILDDKMKSEFGHAYPEGAKYKDLSEPQQEIVKEQVDLDEMSKFMYNKQFKDLEALEGKKVKDLHNIGKRAIADEHGKTVGVDDNPANVKDSSGNVIGKKFKVDYLVDMSTTQKALGEFVQALRKGSYDIRNLPDMSAKTKGFPKVGVGTIALIAAGVRLGLKKGGGVEYGTSQGDILKDIGNTVTEALKNVKINVSSGGRHGGDDHGHKEVKSVGH